MSEGGKPIRPCDTCVTGYYREGETLMRCLRCDRPIPGRERPSTTGSNEINVSITGRGQLVLVMGRRASMNITAEDAKVLGHALVRLAYTSEVDSGG